MSIATPTRMNRRRLSDADYKYQQMAFAQEWSTYQLQFQIKEARAMLASRELCQRTRHRMQLALDVFQTVLNSRLDTRR